MNVIQIYLVWFVSTATFKLHVPLCCVGFFRVFTMPTDALQ